jgi:hypothetical protein
LLKSGMTGISYGQVYWVYWVYCYNSLD